MLEAAAVAAVASTMIGLRAQEQQARAMQGFSAVRPDMPFKPLEIRACAYCSTKTHRTTGNCHSCGAPL